MCYFAFIIQNLSINASDLWIILTSEAHQPQAKKKIFFFENLTRRNCQTHATFTLFEENTKFNVGQIDVCKNKINKRELYI